MFRVIVILLMLTGCTTALWAPNYEEEWVNGFYVNLDTDELFVTTRETAYVFPIERDLGEALLLTRRAAFYPAFDKFVVNDKNQVEGTVSLVFIESNPSPALLQKINTLGFEEDELTNRLQLLKTIKGRRYLIEGELPLEKLEKEYRIIVAQPPTFTEAAGKIVATPAAIAIDTVVTVPAAFLGATIMALVLRPTPFDTKA